MGARGPEADVTAIRQLIDDYSDAVFRRDASDWGACWAEDARWSLSGHVVESRAQIVALWETAMAGFPFVAFFAQPVKLDQLSSSPNNVISTARGRGSPLAGRISRRTSIRVEFWSGHGRQR